MPDPDLRATRAPQPAVPPIVFNGKRYQQVINAEQFAHKQRTGFLAVYREEDNQILSLIKVYEVSYNEDLEADVQDVFFTRMELDADKRQLLIENEQGQRYLVDLPSGVVAPAEEGLPEMSIDAILKLGEEDLPK